MPKSIKIITLSLLLVTILGLFSFYGCGNAKKSTPWVGIPLENLNQEQLQQMLSDSVENYGKLEAYKLYMTQNIVTDTIGGSNPWNTTLNTTIASFVNVASEQTQMQLDMSMTMEGMGQSGEEQNLTYDMYAMKDQLYISLFASNMGGGWVKVPLSSKIKQTLNLNIVDQQMKPLDTPTKIEYLRTEQVNGIDCYVLSISPNADEMAQWLGEQAANSININWQDLVNNHDIFKTFSLLYYVTKDSNVIMRMTLDMAIELTPAEAGTPSSDYDKTEMSLKMDMKVYDPNVPNTITLPDEALNATPISEDVFLNGQ